MKKERTKKIVEQVLSIVLFALIWKTASATGIFGRVSVRSSNLLLPPPEKAVASLIGMLASGYLEWHIWVSLWRVIRGFVIAALIGVPMGILMGSSKDFYNCTDLIFRLFSPIPGVAWVPLAILWFGLGDGAALFIITMGSLSPIIINTRQGVQDVDPNLRQALQTMGAGRWQIVRYCILPGIIPHILNGFRLGLGFAWRVVIAAELVGVPDGLGYVLNMGRSTGRTDITVVTILVLGILMIVMDDALFGTVEKKLSHWKTDRETG